jgi:hypothetical protein
MSVSTGKDAMGGALRRITGLGITAVVTSSVLVAAVGCGKSEQTSNQSPDGQSQNQSSSQTASGNAGMANPHAAGELEWTAGSSWISEQPSSGMRKAQYRVPGPGGDAELAVFYFGPGQGGDAMTNATRWANQFTKEDGSPAVDQLKTRDAEVNGMPVTFVEVAGTYTNTMVSPEPYPGYALLGAIVKGPDANWFFKLTGPANTIEAARADFEQMIESAHPKNHG